MANEIFVFYALVDVMYIRIMYYGPLLLLLQTFICNAYYTCPLVCHTLDGISSGGGGGGGGSPILGMMVGNPGSLVPGVGGLPHGALNQTREGNNVSVQASSKPFQNLLYCKNKLLDKTAL